MKVESLMRSFKVIGTRETGVSRRKEGRIADMRRIIFCKLNLCHWGK
jgi:hypothetical protein